MGAKVSTLVFRPPKLTKMAEEHYFYLDVDVTSPLSVSDVDSGRGGGAGCGAMGDMCSSISNHDADLTSLDSSFLGSEHNKSGSINGSIGDDDSSSWRRQKNARNGVTYKIPAFFIRRRNAKQTILFSHGNAEDLGMMFARMKELAVKLSVNIMAYDYTGYGMSLPMGEKPSENMVYRNIEAAYEYLTKVRMIQPSDIILYGRSLGGGPSCYLAAKTAMQGQSVGGLVLHSAFLSVYKVVTEMNGLDMQMVGDMFHNEKRARNIRCPTLIIHGKCDVVVPFWHAPRLLSAIPKEHRWKPLFVEDIGHNSIEVKKRDMYLHSMTNFINGVRIMKEMNAPIHPDFRAKEEDVMDNVGFYVNTMWLKHAKVALTDSLFPSRKMSSNLSCSSISVNSGKKELSENYPSALAANNELGSSRHRSYSGHNGVGGNNFMSDARDEEDEFAPWREEARQQSESSNKRSSTPPTTGDRRQLTPRRSQSALIDKTKKDNKQYRKSHSMQLQVSQRRQRSGSLDLRRRR
jgi:pimeloyl-ACP methyl ester carboxylesterase